MRDDGSTDGTGGPDGSAEAVEPEPRRHPSTIGGMFYLLVLAATGLGVGIVVWTGDWRRGVTWIGGALVAAAEVGLVLRNRDAGMLAVRHRLVDVGLLVAVGVVLIVLADTIPNQPTLP